MKRGHELHRVHGMLESSRCGPPRRRRRFTHPVGAEVKSASRCDFCIGGVPYLTENLSAGAGLPLTRPEGAGDFKPACHVQFAGIVVALATLYLLPVMIVAAVRCFPDEAAIILIIALAGSSLAAWGLALMMTLRSSGRMTGQTAPVTRTHASVPGPTLRWARRTDLLPSRPDPPPPLILPSRQQNGAALHWELWPGCSGQTATGRDGLR